jgi:hypothetical protein
MDGFSFNLDNSNMVAGRGLVRRQPARGEYRFADFGTWNNTLDLSVPNASNFVHSDLKAVTHTAAVGLAYKF